MVDNIKEDRLMAMPDVERVAGIKRSLIYKLIKEGRFPRGRTVGKRSRRWRATEVQAWIAEMST